MFLAELSTMTKTRRGGSSVAVNSKQMERPSLVFKGLCTSTFQGKTTSGTVRNFRDDDDELMLNVLRCHETY